MRYRKLGRWGVNVSVVGLGSWLTYGGAVEAGAARDCIVRAFERGINFFDTANVYARGGAMNDLVRAGKILYWGVSEWTADQIIAAVTLCRARGWAEPVSNQPQYSALWRRIEARVLPACREYGLGNVVWSPLAMGILSGKYTDAANPPSGSRAAGQSAEMMDRYYTQAVLDAVQRLKPLAH